MRLLNLDRTVGTIGRAAALGSVLFVGQAVAAELTIGTRSEMTMDPHFFWSTPNRAYNVQIYGSLVRLDNSMRTRPMIAKDWSLVDGTTWDFEIDPTARFHNGAKVTAKDVEVSFDRALNLENAAANTGKIAETLTAAKRGDESTRPQNQTSSKPKALNNK